MVALGLLLLVVAGVLAVAGVLSNLGSSHLLANPVNILGYHLNGSTGRAFLVALVIGAVGMLGLNMLLAGLGRGLKNSVHRRTEKKQLHNQAETAQQERDRLAKQLEEEREARARAEAQVASPPYPTGTVVRDTTARVDDAGATRS